MLETLTVRYVRSILFKPRKYVNSIEKIGNSVSNGFNKIFSGGKEREYYISHISIRNISGLFPRRES